MGRGDGPRIGALGLRPDTFYYAVDVAALVFKRPASWFHKERQALTASGFPKPISPIGRLRWRGSDLLEWLREREGDPFGAPTAEGLSGVLSARAMAVAPERGQRRKKAPARCASGVVIPFRRPGAKQPPD